MPLLRDIRDTLGSSYLLDHVDNPVMWRDWSEASLHEARVLDRPVFLSIGYAACHWCHVMAHESFEDDDIALILNEQFIPIKVDREERPDVDALYMAATQLVSGHGGWPMSVFLAPDGRPFMAGTYYPPTDRAGHTGFTRLLNALSDAWTTQRDTIEEQCDRISNALIREVQFVDHLAPSSEVIDLESVRSTLSRALIAQVDDNGGFGGAPKFPRPSFVNALLDVTDDDARDAATLTLDAMARRGMYDHFGGGFARYSVDGEWHVPHFEKMLSDQALLARCYLRASIRLKNPEWRTVALDTIRFVKTALARSDGFASSLDADAGGVEGSHVTWTPEEVSAALSGVDSETLARTLQRWRISSPGLFEGRSIPRLADGEPFEVPEELATVHQRMKEHRAARVQPHRDEKIVLEWNAMFASALLWSNEPSYIADGAALLRSLQTTHFDGTTWWRTERRQAFATSSDLAWFADAALDAYEATGDDEWRSTARATLAFLIEHYWDGEVPTAQRPDVGQGVFTQSDLVVDTALRVKEIFDGATPSSHAVATRALARFGLCSGDNDTLVIAQRLVTLAGSLLASHPTAVPDLVEAAGFAYEGIEVVVPGVVGSLANHVRSLAMPRTVLITGSGTSPLLAGRSDGAAYVCQKGVCQLPVRSTSDLELELNKALS